MSNVSCCRAVRGSACRGRPKQARHTSAMPVRMSVKSRAIVSLLCPCHAVKSRSTAAGQFRFAVEPADRTALLLETETLAHSARSPAVKLHHLPVHTKGKLIVPPFWSIRTRGWRGGDL